MNRFQWLAVATALGNLVLMLTFPPYDYISMQRGAIPSFDGFYFVFGSHAQRVVNANFLTLEIIVVTVNAAIAWLLLRTPGNAAQRRMSGNYRQRMVLGLVAVNLVLMLLFPPFENIAAMTKAALPTFEGFHFVFGDNSQRHLVAPILYIEVFLALANGALLWLLLKDKTADEIAAERFQAMARNVRGAKKT